MNVQISELKFFFTGSNLPELLALDSWDHDKLFRVNSKEKLVQEQIKW